MKQKTILAIDCGTQSLRSLLFGLDGTLIDKEQVVYEAPYVSPKPGWAEQNPDVYWDAVCKTSLALAERHPDLYASIAGVGVTTQRASMVCLDEEGKVLRPSIIWLDQRKAMAPYKPSALLRGILTMVGAIKPVMKSQTKASCNWIMQNEPEIWKKTAKFVQVSGFINKRLTGVFGDSVASQIGYIPFDAKKQAWAKPGSLKAKMFPIEPEKLDNLVPAGDKLGEITAEASKATGIPVGIPVIACGSDKGCETLASGVIDGTAASISFGTTATIQSMSKKYFEPVQFMPAYPACLPGQYNTEVEIFRGFWMVSWFKNEFCAGDIAKAKELGTRPEVLMDQAIAKIPAGSMGLMVEPSWSPSLERPAAKGCMVGFGDIHTRPYVYRAILEGLCFSLREGMEKTEKKGKLRFSRIAVSGGGSQSDIVCRIAADVLNRPIVKGRTHETSGLGAAIMTAKGIGEFKNFEEAIDKMVNIEKTYEPEPANVATYNQLFDVHRKLYPQLRWSYRKIRNITGYPEKEVY